MEYSGAKAKTHCVNLLVGSDSKGDKVEDELLKIYFHNATGVDKQRILDYLRDNAASISDPSLKGDVLKYIHDLETDEKIYKDYFAGLKNALIRSLTDKHISKDTLVLLTHAAYWQYFAIAIKKCIGNPKYVINKNDYNTRNKLFLCRNNRYQEDCHKLCLKSFNYNSDIYSFSKNPMLWLFLHKIHSTCKKERTKKKNISRVTKKAKRVARAYKACTRNDTIFTFNRYEVIDQFQECIVRCLWYS